MSAVTKEVNSILRVTEAKLAKLMGCTVALWMRPLSEVKVDTATPEAYNALIVTCCIALKVSVKDVSSESKKRELNDARFIIAHLLTEQFKLTREYVGQLIDNCDHSTITNRLKTYAALIEKNKIFQQKVKLCQQALTEITL
jgi:chromosomal replication initiation ATPase DnaA